MKPREDNYLYLLAGMLFLLFLVPLARDLDDAAFLQTSKLAFSAFLIISIWSLRGTKLGFRLAIVLVVLGSGGNVLFLTGAGAYFSYLSLGSYIIFQLLAIGLAIQNIFRSDRVDANVIVGAVCIYLLLGVSWSLIYAFVSLLIPGSFSGDITGSIYQQLLDFVHFSFVTLTSLGYGDIVPIGATARALATIEVIVGQFYMTILVAGLVAAYMKRSEASDTDSERGHAEK